MTESVVQNSPLKQLPDRVMVARQLTTIGAKALAGMRPPSQTGEDVLRRLAQECGLEFTALDDIEPGRQLLSLFAAGTSAGKATAPEIGCAIGPSAHTDDILKKSDNKKGRELK